MKYEELQDALTKLPKEWYRGLLQTMVISAYKHGVFLHGGASSFVAAIEEATGHEFPKLPTTVEEVAEMEAKIENDPTNVPESLRKPGRVFEEVLRRMKDNKP